MRKTLEKHDIFILMRYLGRQLYLRNRVQQKAMGDISALVQESLSGGHVIRTFGIQGQRQEAEAQDRDHLRGEDHPARAFDGTEACQNDIGEEGANPEDNEQTRKLGIAAVIDVAHQDRDDDEDAKKKAEQAAEL